MLCHPTNAVELRVLQYIVQALDMMAKHKTVSSQWERTIVNLLNNPLWRSNDHEDVRPGLKS
uniref:Uncharacterized protein n=1 Tax=Triticum urartu TaxID=4572 RepID=A0A8R7JVC7_TRIUA